MQLSYYVAFRFGDEKKKQERRLDRKFSVFLRVFVPVPDLRGPGSTGFGISVA